MADCPPGAGDRGPPVGWVVVREIYDSMARLWLGAVLFVSIPLIVLGALLTAVVDGGAITLVVGAGISGVLFAIVGLVFTFLRA